MKRLDLSCWEDGWQLDQSGGALFPVVRWADGKASAITFSIRETGIVGTEKHREVSIVNPVVK